MPKQINSFTYTTIVMMNVMMINNQNGYKLNANNFVQTRIGRFTMIR